MQYLPRTFFQGVNARKSETDLELPELRDCLNFSFIERPGSLLPDKGYTQRFSEVNTDCSILASFLRQDNGDHVIVSNDGSSIVYWVNTGSRVVAEGGLSLDHRRAVGFENVVRISGFTELASVTAYEPRWFSYIKRDRFYITGDVYDESISGYFSKKKGVTTPLLTTSSTPSDYDVLIAAVGSGSGSFPDDTYYYKVSLVYDGFQETPLSTNFKSVTTSGNSAIDVSLTVHSNINERVTAINLYRSTEARSGYHYLRTIYLAGDYIANNFVYWVVSSDTYVYTFSDSTETLLELYENRITYTATQNVTPLYKYSVTFEGLMYVGCVRTVTQGLFSDENVLKRQMQFSVAGEPDVIPETNYINFPNEVTGVGTIRNYVVVFTKTDMYFVIENAIKEEKNGVGCWAHDSIAKNDDVLYWASREGVYRWDGLRAENISLGLIKPYFDGLSDSEVESLAGFYSRQTKEYYLYVKNSSQMWVWSEEGRGWRRRDANFSVSAIDENSQIIASEGSYIVDFLDGYQYDNGAAQTAYNCMMLTGKMQLDQKMLFNLIRFFMRYKLGSSGTLTVDVLMHDSVVRSVTFPAQSVEKMSERSLAGYDTVASAMGREAQVRITLSTPSAEDAIDHIGVEYEVNNLN